VIVTLFAAGACCCENHAASIRESRPVNTDEGPSRTRSTSRPQDDASIRTFFRLRRSISASPRSAAFPSACYPGKLQIFGSWRRGERFASRRGLYDDSWWLNVSCWLPYSHSIVPGGFEVMSYTTRLTPFTSFTIRLEIVFSTSCGRGTQSAVMPSSE
jgi:hypothetical protein